MRNGGIGGNILSLILLLTLPGVACSGTSTTCYLDGALVTQELKVQKGAVELLLPAAYVDNSLRVKALDGKLETVTVLPARRDAKTSARIESLRRRKELLEDRLKGLEAREEIFRSAAKSQSGKGLRRSKNNPEPLEAVKEGTNFALDQLEDVYRRRRAAERELQQVSAQLVEAEKAAPGPVARVKLAGLKGRIGVTYLRMDLRWKPSYEIRSRSGVAAVTVRPQFPPQLKGDVAVAPAALSGAGAAPVWRQFPVVVKASSVVVPGAAAPVPVSGFSLKNEEAFPFPAGPVSCFDGNGYIGTGEMKELKPGEKIEVTCGRHG